MTASRNEPTPPPPGETRTHLARNHAVIGPDSYVVAPLPGWVDTQGVVLIAPAMGPARCGPEFVQYLAHLSGDSVGRPAPHETQRFVYVLDGSATVGDQTIGKGGYAWVPPTPDDPREGRLIGPEIRGEAGTRLWIHEELGFRRFEIDAEPPVAPIFGHVDEVNAEPFMGDPAARLARLLPRDAAFDLEINRFTFDPGAALPLVESHVNEHGLYMLEGAGVYRLGSGPETHWQTVQAGDAIWMGAFCPQWFCCFGTSPATYLYSKNVNRHALG